MNENQVSCKPCDQCRKGKVFCDKRMPNCKRCLDFNRSCSYLFVPRRNVGTSVKLNKLKLLSESKKVCIEFVPFTEFNFDNKSDGGSIRDERRVATKIKFKGNAFDKIKRYYSTIKVEVDCSRFKLATNLFNISLMHPNHKVFVSTTGKLDYFGINPFALLLTMYVVHHTKPDNLSNCIEEANNNENFKDNSIESRDELPITNKLDLKHIENGLTFDQIKDMALEAFFEYFHTHLPVLNRKKIITNFSHQPKLLKYLVIGIGIGYLPFVCKSVKYHYCKLAKLELVKSYNKFTLNTIAALLIMNVFQHNKEDCKDGYLNLGQAIRISHCLGLHLKPPKHMDKYEKELRVRLYWLIHAYDKLYGFTMTVPFSHDYRLCLVRKSRYIECDYLDDDKDENRLTQLCSITYLNLFSEVCQMLYIIKLQFDFIDNIKESQLSQLIYFANTIDTHLSRWEFSVSQTFSLLNQGIQWKIKITNRFELFLKLFYNSVLTQLFQSFSKIKLEPTVTQFKQKATNHSKQAILCALNLKTDFFYYGLTYKFYFLVTAVFYWIKVASNSQDENQVENIKLLKDALTLIKNCKPYYLIAEESLVMATVLAKSENLDLD